MDTEIKAIVFDLGRVLVDFDHRIAAEKIAKFSPNTTQQIYDLFFDSTLTRSFEEGKVSSDEFFCRVVRALGIKISFIRFLSIWNRIFFLSRENKAVYALAKRLKIKYQIALLSNISAPHFAYLKKNFPIFDVFHRIFASCEMGCMKPNPVIYRKVIFALGVKSEEIFYTDDRPELVETARRLGIRGFVFKGLKQLKADLDYCGVKVDPLGLKVRAPSRGT